MSYITANRPVLQQTHYITNARAHYWYNFYSGTLERHVRLYGEDFCLVINGSTAYDDAYVLPFKCVKDFFSPDYIDAHGRWMGDVEGVTVRLWRKGKPGKSIGAGEFHNAFHLFGHNSLTPA